MIGIYMWTFKPEPDRVYIGQAFVQSLEKRKKEYERPKACGIMRQRKMYEAVLQYGIQAFDYSILAEFEEGTVDLETINRMEIDFIRQYEAVKKGFNLMEGGRNRGKHSPESIERMSICKRGKTASAETKAKMSAWQKGVKKGPTTNPITLAKLRARKMTDYQKERISWKGKRHSEETKKKMSEASKGRKIPQASLEKLMKKVYQIDKNTNEIIKEWESMSEAQRFLNRKSGPISRCCYGKQKIAFGFVWKFVA